MENAAKNQLNAFKHLDFGNAWIQNEIKNI